MPPGWSSASLGDLVEDIIDRRGVTPRKLGSTFVSEGHRVISAMVVKKGRVDLGADEPRFVDDSTYERWMRTPLAAGDVVLTSEAPLGEVAYLHDDVDWCLGQRLFAIRTDKKTLDGRFLYYALQSGPVRHELQSRGTGTTAEGIRQSELRQVRIPLPPLEEQHSIVRILSAFDDRVEVNLRMNVVVEELALVDLDRRLALPGASEVQFLDLMQLHRETVDPQAARKSVFDHYSLPAYDDGRLPVRQPGAEIKSAKLAVPDGAVLVAKLNPLIPRVWLPLPGSPSVLPIASTEFMVLTPRAPASSAFLFSLWRSMSARAALTSRVTGTSGSHQRVRPEDVLASTVVVPAEKEIRRHTEFAAPLYDRYIANLQQSQTLVALRAALLSRLVTGQLRVGPTAAQGGPL